ncbi:21317_t:CDS:2, partial [Entrophospora sp. SA101]
EKRLGDWNVLFNSIPLLSLISENDANRVSNLLSNISSSSFSVDFTLDTGPWNGLIEMFLIMVEYDPWAIYLDRLSETAYESIVGAGYLLLCLCYAG